jgi:tryptophan-rich sensory protein
MSPTPASYGLQPALNLGCSLLFFGARMIRVALIDIVLCWRASSSRSCASVPVHRKCPTN